MPPSTHYLNLLNHPASAPLTNDDISKELELFTNSEFLDAEEYFGFEYPRFEFPYVNQPALNQIGQGQPGQIGLGGIGQIGGIGQNAQIGELKKGSEEVETPKSRSLEEEDKRRRNTAASARFRVKKKQREQALQETAKAVQDRNAQLEARVKELELENKWLRGLLRPNSNPKAN